MSTFYREHSEKEIPPRMSETLDKVESPSEDLRDVSGSKNPQGENPDTPTNPGVLESRPTLQSWDTFEVPQNPQGALLQAQLQAQEAKPVGEAPVKKSPKRTASGNRTIGSLWGEEVMKPGWVPVPTTLLRNWRYLGGIDRTDVLLLLLLMDYRRNDGSYRPVSVKALSKQLKMGDRAVRTRIKNLKERDYLKQSQERGKKRTYDLQPLFDKLTQVHVKWEIERGQAA